MDLPRLLDMRPGVTAVIGSGGKTTLLRALGDILSAEHRVLLCTTTKMLPYPDLPWAKTEGDLRRLGHRLLCAGVPVPGTEKLTAPDLPFARLAEEFDYVLVEADGAAHRPMKAHAPWEPVLPPERNQTICVVGAAGFGRPIHEAAHRPGRFAELAGVAEEVNITPELAAAVLTAEGLATRYFINQAEGERLAPAQNLAALLPAPGVVGSLWKGEYSLC
ncbi:MAG: selenium cofactor biosynthesis protein YqeC [Oscillibacter sp.]